MSSDTRSDRRLFLSIHDVGPKFERQVEQLRALLARHAPVDRIALLVVPDHWGEAPLTRGTAFATKLRGWTDAGAEVFVHGWFHRDDSVHSGRAARLKARHMTAGEGEFLGLSHGEALRRMRDGRHLIEDITGRPATGFIAPAWLYGAGATAALADAGFEIAENHRRVWNPATGRVLACDPVLTWASRSRARILSSLAAARVLPPVLRALPTARIGVHPGDTTVPALLDSIDRAVGGMRRTHAPARYADLLAA
ncbi:polysaccharide deacetylase [Sphingomonas sp. Leaf33]|uniref:DUF2334 domain-containing protein n=1 Tax=Sphingomonas sp. Leaf33 TaxID=1736215 RepID=UPI0006F47903|nr:DUF2334 domain-containing protein [Sphingomonas sp. Leaf33]KQN19407.1 polysaccharide deacetylase [Sphingomonas sp. Leaf33]